jgi:hypothetical protein
MLINYEADKSKLQQVENVRIKYRAKKGLSIHKIADMFRSTA